MSLSDRKKAKPSAPPPPPENQIIEVWKDNLEEEMKNVCKLVEQGYNVIAMDTEFPGIIYTMPSQQMVHATSWYEVLRENVNNLELIQVGITLSNKQGIKPQPVNTWQFNMQFSLTKNKYSVDSINVLKEAGIDFQELEVMKEFALTFRNEAFTQGTWGMNCICPI